MHTSPGFACAASTTCQPRAFSIVSIACGSPEFHPLTRSVWKLIRPAFCSTAETKFAQQTSDGTFGFMSSAPLRFSSDALRPRNDFARSTTLLPSAPDVELGPCTGPVECVPLLLPLPGTCTVWPG